MVLLSVLALPFVVAAASSTAGLTYHGRLLKPDGRPVTGAVQFLLQLRTPGPSNCLLYQEEKFLDLSDSLGLFSLTLNDGTGTILNGSYPLDRVFANRGTFVIVHPNLECGGTNVYTPSVADGRMLKVFFNDGSFSGWEPLPAQTVNFAPSAIEAIQVGGFRADHLLRVQDASESPQTVPALSPGNFTELLALINGTSTQYLANGSVPACGPGEVLSSDGSGFSCVADAGGWTAVDATTSQKGLVLLAANGGTGAGTVVQATDSRLSNARPPAGAASGDLSGNYPGPSIAQDAVYGDKIANGGVGFNKIASGTTDGEVLFWGGGSWSAKKMGIDDLVNSIGGSPWPALPCGAGEALAWLSVSDGFVCQSLKGNYFAQGGNTFGGPAVLGTADGQTLHLQTGGANRITVLPDGSVGIGTTSPSKNLEVSASDSSPEIRVVNTDSTAPRGPRISIRNYTNGEGGQPFISMLSSRGTNLATEAIQEGDRLGAFEYAGVFDTAGRYDTAADVFSEAAGLFSSTSTPGRLILRTTPSGSRSLQERLRIESDGRVGIGTPSPLVSLDLGSKKDAIRLPSGATADQPASSANGMIRYNSETHKFEAYENGGWVNMIGGLASGASSVAAGAGSASSPSISFSGDADTGFYSSGANSIGVSASGAKLFDFSTLGMISPNAGGASVASGTGSAAAPTFSFKGDEDTGWYSAGPDTLAASTGGVERMRINADGRVGIGTMSPETPLHVVETSPTPSRGVISEQIDNTDIAALFIMRKTRGAAGSTAPLLAGDYIGNIRFQGYNGTSHVDAASIYARASEDFSSTQNGSSLFFKTTDVGTATAKTRMTIFSDGNVGIGTESPTAKFEVNHVGTMNADLPVMTLRASSPSTDMGSATSLNMDFVITDSNTTAPSAPQARISVKPGGSGTGYDEEASGQLIFSTALGTDAATPNSNTLYERMRISPSGNVGIGTTNPTSALHVVGSGGAALQVSAQAEPGKWARMQMTSGEGYNFNIYKESTGRTQFTNNITPGTDDFAFKIGSNEVFNILENGNVGIGTTNPVEMLHIAGNINVPYTFKLKTNGNTSNNNLLNNYYDGSYDKLEIAPNGNSRSRIGFLTTNINATAPVEVMSIASTGNVGIGTTNPLHRLSIADGAIMLDNDKAIRWKTTSGQDRAMIYLRSDDVLRLGNGNADGADAITFHTEGHPDAMYIARTGNVGIGTSAPAYPLDVSGQVNISTRLRIDGTQVCTVSGCTSSSDRRLKERIAPLPESLHKVLSLDPMSYYWIDKEKYGSGREVGFVAQELEKVFPEVVRTDPESGLKSVSYGNLVAPLVKAFKELAARVLDLETDLHRKIASLEEESAQMRQQNETLRAQLAEWERERSDIIKRLENLEGSK